MQVEIEHLSPIEKELHFRSWQDKRGVVRFLLDLDDTICPTRKLFTRKIVTAASYLAESYPILTQGKWLENIEKGNNLLFETMGVATGRWNLIIDEITARYSVPEDISQNAKQILSEMYTTPLSFLPEAEAALNFFHKTATPLGIITHGSYQWTQQKYEWLRLNRFLPWSDVFIVDENGHKDASSWQSCLDYFRLSPYQCTAVGDSPLSDINPAFQIGIKHRFLVRDPNLWSVHLQPVPVDTHLIDNLNQIIKIAIVENLTSSQTITRRH